MSAPQWVAIGLLIIEVVIALKLRGKSKPRTGWNLLIDAFIWTSVLYFGGFWNK